MGELWDRCWRVVAGAGLEVAGLRNACGDLIYSGHTIALMIACLTVSEYAPKRLQAPMSSVVSLLAGFGVVGIVTSRLHYTIDVAIAYYCRNSKLSPYNTSYRYNTILGILQYNTVYYHSIIRNYLLGILY